MSHFNAVLAWLGLDLDILLESLKVIGLLLFVVVSGAWLTWGERRLLGLWQDRYGPNRVGPFGLGIVIADMVKAFFKEDWTPSFVDKATFILAPMISFASPILIFAIVPVAPNLVVADIHLGILFFLAIASLSVYAVMFAAWASNNKYALLGGLRSAAQMLSYEVFMGIALMGVVVLAGSFRLGEIVAAQENLWYVVTQPLGFFLFMVGGIATTHRTPFDLPEAEHELTAGYHTEYSSLKFAMFMLSEYIGIVTISALVVVLYFGGWHGPWLPPIVWFALKLGFFIALFILIRAAWPRPRYDQFMAFGWKALLPLSLVNLLVTGAAVLIWPGA